jgi:hypothetical protein
VHIKKCRGKGFEPLDFFHIGAYIFKGAEIVKLP